MHKDVEKILFDKEQIAARVQELGRTITDDYAGKPLTVVGILKGGSVFMADLIRAIDLPVHIDFIEASSYGEKTETSGEVRITKDLSHSIEGRHVLIVEDIIDSGLTLTYLRQNLLTRNPLSVKICSMLDKPSRRKVNLVPDYCGYEVPDVFIIGYGLDYAEDYRNMPDIGILRREVYEGK